MKVLNRYDFFIEMRGEKELKKRIYERHQVIAKALIALGVDEETAYDDSCKIEHDLSDITFQKIKEYFLSHTNENI